MKKQSWIVLVALLFSSVMPALAENPAKAEKATLVAGTVIGADGVALNFVIPAGELISLRSVGLNQQIALMPRLTPGDPNAVRFEAAMDNQRASVALGKIELRPGQQQVIQTPDSWFSVRLDRVVQVDRPQQGAASLVAACPSCTLTCGSLTVTCEVCASGWCCDMTCSLGGSCSACNSTPQES